MLPSRLTLLLPCLALGLTFTQPSIARAEHPLEKLHKKIFGDDDRKKDDKKKDKDRKDDRDDHRGHDHRSDDRRYDDRRYDNSRYYRNDPVIVERRVYVEPAPRPYYENRYEPSTRYYNTRSLEADVQSALRRQGYYYGPVDGDIGPGTRSAIRNYQIDRRLPVTGRIDTYLIRSLGL